MSERASEATRQPPRPTRSQRDFVTQHQRARIIAALAEETAEKGFRAATVADIVKRAGVARNTFYENFASKEDCFLATAEFGVREAPRRVVAAASQVDSWPARVRVGLAAFLDHVASEPALARTCIVESLSAGPAAVAQYERSIKAFVPLFRMGRAVSPQGGQLPATLEETIVGGIFWIVYQRIVGGRADGIGELLPELVEFSLTPYVGAAGARRAAGISALSA